MAELTGPEVCSNVMLRAICNMVMTTNYRREYMLCGGYITKITISGLMVF